MYLAFMGWVSAEITLIAGLPSSGKTMYMEALRQEGWLILDAYKANAYNDSSIFWHSRNYKALLMALREGRECVVADIDFWKTTSRHEAETALRAQIPDLTLNWLFFETGMNFSTEMVGLPSHEISHLKFSSLNT